MMIVPDDEETREEESVAVPPEMTIKEVVKEEMEEEEEREQEVRMRVPEEEMMEAVCPEEGTKEMVDASNFPLLSMEKMCWLGEEEGMLMVVVSVPE
jgi:hypothetical protein